MTDAEKMAIEYAKTHSLDPDLHCQDVADDWLAGWRARGARDAELAFEHIRCDDRTDRWLVANVVAGHIRRLDEEEK